MSFFVIEITSEFDFNPPKLRGKGGGPLRRGLGDYLTELVMSVGARSRYKLFFAFNMPRRVKYAGEAREF